MKIIPYFVDAMPSGEDIISRQSQLDDRAKIIGKKLCENLKLLENFADNVL